MTENIERTSKGKDWYFAKVNQLKKDNEDYNDLIYDITYILSDDELLKTLFMKFGHAYGLDIDSYELLYEFLTFFYECNLKYLDISMTKESFLKTKKAMYANLLKTKKSWINMAEKSVDKKQNKYIYKEMLEWDPILRRTPEAFSRQFGNEDLNSILDYRKEKFKSWLDTDKLLTDFTYFDELTLNKKLNGIKIDLIIHILSIISDEYNSCISLIRRKMPEDFIMTGNIFSLTTREQGISEVIESGNSKQIFQQKMSFDTEHTDNIALISSVLQFDPLNVEVEEDTVINNKFLNFLITNTLSSDVYETLKNDKKIVRKLFATLTLDAIDRELLKYIINKAVTPTIRVYYSEFLDQLGMSKCKQTYDNIEYRINKLKGYSYFGYLSDDTKIILDFLSTTVHSRNNNGRFADITLSPTLSNALTKGRVYYIYQKELQKLNSSNAEELAYVFEMDRTKIINDCIISNYKKKYKIDSNLDVINNNIIDVDQNNILASLYEIDIDQFKLFEKEYTYSLAYFSQFIKFPKRNSIQANMDILNEGISKLCDNNLILTTYKRNINSFTVKYCPKKLDNDIRNVLLKPNIDL